VARSAEQFAFDEPIGDSRGLGSTAHAVTETAENTERPNIDRETRAVCMNPLRDEPSPLAIGAVKRFGLIGLVSVAVGTGIARWWNSLSSRDH
jgi:hypothetical protein